MIDVRAHLARKPLLFDGGMGTYYKAKPGTECEQANLLDPAGVLAVHREYLAGRSGGHQDQYVRPAPDGGGTAAGLAGAGPCRLEAGGRSRCGDGSGRFCGPGPGSGYRGCPGGKHLHGSGPLFCGAGGKELPV